MCPYLVDDLRAFQNLRHGSVSGSDGWRDNFKQLDGTNVGITFDGTDVAMTRHLPKIIKFLG